jgi:hypothetical protein
MRILKRILGQDPRARALKAREQRAEEIESLGLKLVDRSGWVDGKYSPKRYEIERDGTVVAGPFSSSSEALQAARNLTND